MDAQFCKASRSVREKRYVKRVEKLSKRLLSKYLISIGKEVSATELDQLSSSLTRRITDKTKEKIDFLMSNESAGDLSEDEIVQEMLKLIK